MTARGAEYTTTVEHSQQHWVTNSDSYSTATLTATFVYNNQTVSCVSKYESYTSDVLTTKSLTASPESSTTGTVMVQLKYLFNIVKPQNHSLTIKCTPKGNVSKSKG